MFLSLRVELHALLVLKVNFEEQLGLGVTPQLPLFNNGLIYTKLQAILPIPVTQRSKAGTYGRWLAGIAGSNLAANMNVCPV
jgi:hypothetical protein